MPGKGFVELGIGIDILMQHFDLNVVKLLFGFVSCSVLCTSSQHADTWKQASPERTRTFSHWFWSGVEGSHTSFSCLTAQMSFFPWPEKATVWSFLSQVCESCNPTVAWWRWHVHTESQCRNWRKDSQSPGSSLVPQQDIATWFCMCLCRIPSLPFSVQPDIWECHLLWWQLVVSDCDYLCWFHSVGWPNPHTSAWCPKDKYHRHQKQNQRRHT